MIKSYPIENEMMCVADCGLDCDCFMTIYSPNKCELYKKEAQDYLNKTLTDTLNIYYKKDMLSLPLYLVNGKLFCIVSFWLLLSFLKSEIFVLRSAEPMVF